MCKVRLSGIVPESVCDGPGLRTVLFFQGCCHYCIGCHNPQTWPFDGGEEFTVSDLLRTLPDSPLITGITFSGGDPFYQAEAAALIAKELHNRGKNIWAYTGFKWEELLMESNPSRIKFLLECDVLVDGPFNNKEVKIGLIFRGSLNQRIILVKESFFKKRIILWEPQ